METFPDGDAIRESRLYAAKKGFDHYWRWHESPTEWAKWCPWCRMKVENDFYADWAMGVERLNRIIGGDLDA